MADDSSERTEEPTAQRLKKAREEGQVARSVELSTAAILVAATLFFSLSGSYLFHRLGTLFTSQLQFDRKVMDKAELLPAIFFQSVIDGYVLILPVMALLAVVALLSTVMSGGLIFSPKMVLPNFGKLDPMAGLARMFGMKALIDLFKTFLKFLVISTILWMSITNNIEDLVALNRMDLGTAVSHAGSMILDACFWMSMGLVVIAIADVPLQHYQVNKKLKMTRQEIKDEMKSRGPSRGESDHPSASARDGQQPHDGQRERRRCRHHQPPAFRRGPELRPQFRRRTHLGGQGHRRFGQAHS